MYHPAPLTKARGANGVTSSVGPKSSRTSKSVEPVALQPPIPNLSSGPKSVARGRCASRSCTFGCHRNPGFLGITSFGSVLKENQASLDIEIAHEDPDVATMTISDENLQRGVEILSLLANFPAFERFIHRWVDLSRGLLVSVPVLQQWISLLWTSHGGVLTSKSPQKLRSLSELVFRNTHRPLTYNSKTTARCWTALASGENLRWEAIGILFSIVGLTAITLPQTDPIFDHIKDMNIGKLELGRKLHDAAEMCEAICNEIGLLHDLSIWLSYENFVLLSSIRGDLDISVWKRAGELFNTVIASGLHQDKDADAETPFFLSQLRKKTFLYVFVYDKVLCTFLGRPPRLLSKYCFVQLPLDLNEQELFMEGQELESALAGLDENGWKKNGEIGRSTWARVFLINALIREEILDLALSIATNDNLKTRADEISRKAKQSYDSLPETVRWSVESTERPDRHPTEYLGALLGRLTYLTNDLILQRTLIRRAGTDSTQLVLIAKTIFEEVIGTVVQRDLMRDYQLDFISLVSLSP